MDFPSNAEISITSTELTIVVKNDKGVSVLVFTRKTAVTLKEAVDSFLSQPFTPDSNLGKLFTEARRCSRAEE